jgi:hypothetical protein
MALEMVAVNANERLCIRVVPVRRGKLRWPVKDAVRAACQRSVEIWTGLAAIFLAKWWLVTPQLHSLRGRYSNTMQLFVVFFTSLVHPFLSRLVLFS